MESAFTKKGKIKVLIFDYIGRESSLNMQHSDLLSNNIGTGQLESYLKTYLSMEEGLPALCIWGSHGIGKTEIVQETCTVLGYEQIYFALAQYEELGDLIGMPEIEGAYTQLRAPHWTDKLEADKGILLLDDINRADRRVLNAILPLLQWGKMPSWQIPKSWKIICTANPNDGNYFVNSMDDALLSRMVHVKLNFDTDKWLNWAEGLDLQKWQINLLHRNRSVLEESDFNARSMTHFLNMSKTVQNPELHRSYIEPSLLGSIGSKLGSQLVHSLFGESVAAHQDWLNTENIKQSIRRIAGQDGSWSASKSSKIISEIYTMLRMQDEVEAKDIRLVQELLSWEELPKDQRFYFYKQLLKHPSKKVKALLSLEETTRLFF